MSEEVQESGYLKKRFNELMDKIFFNILHKTSPVQRLVLFILFLIIDLILILSFLLSIINYSGFLPESWRIRIPIKLNEITAGNMFFFLFGCVLPFTFMTYEILKSFRQFEPPPDHITEEHMKKLIEQYAEMVREDNWGIRLETDDKIYTRCFVTPKLVWVRRKLSEPGKDNNLIGGSSEQQSWAIFEELCKSPRTLLIADGAGQGKTILTMKLAADLSKPRRKSSGSDRMMVVRWDKLAFESAWQKYIHALNSQPHDIQRLLEQDDTLRRLAFVLGRGHRVPLTTVQIAQFLRLAVEKERVVWILDGIDEFGLEESTSPGPEKENKLEFITKRMIEQVCGKQSDMSKIRLILAGRPNPLETVVAAKCGAAQFLRISIEAFDSAMRAEFFEKAKLFEGNKKYETSSWSDMLPDREASDLEYLGNPLVLSAIRQRIVELVKNGETLSENRFQSPADLFSILSHNLLEEAIGKLPESEKDKAKDAFSGDMEAFRNAVSEVLDTLAWYMVLEGHFGSVTPKGERTMRGEIKHIKELTSNRYLLGVPDSDRETKQTQFVAAWTALTKIEVNFASDLEEFSQDKLNFRLRSIHEPYVARFLVRYANENDRKALLDHIGDPEWSKILVLASQIPIRPDYQRPGAKQDTYEQFLKCIFKRPSNERHRRPTEAMYKAVELLEVSRKDNLDEFRSKLVAERKKELAEEFQAILRGEAQSVDDYFEKRRLQTIAEGIFRKVDDSGSPKVNTGDSLIVFLADPSDPKFLADPDRLEKTFQDTGEFIMGTPRSHKDAREDDNPVLVKFQRPFGIHRYAIRNKEFQLFDDGHTHDLMKNGELFIGADQPAIEVSWYDAMVFTWFLGELPLEFGNWRWSLPTEAQWEYACRSGNYGAFCFGDNHNELNDYAWFNLNSQRRTHPVGELHPNKSQLYDMHGNVWEWCIDWYFSSLKGGKDPKGPISGTKRVRRGGRWSVNAMNCRSAHREHEEPDLRLELNGFRLAAVHSAENTGQK